MAEKLQHIINKMLLEIDMVSETDALRVKDEAGVFVHDQVLPKMEELFDSLNSGDQHIRFDHIELSLQLKHWNDSEALRAALEKQLIEKMRDIIAGNQSVAEGEPAAKNVEQGDVSPDGNRKIILLYFLQFAHLPWYARKEQLLQLLAESEWNNALGDPVFRKALARLLEQDEAARNRFVFQVPAGRILDFIEKHNKVQLANASAFERTVDALPVTQRTQWLKMLVNRAVMGKGKHCVADLEKLLATFSAIDAREQRSAKALLLHFEQWLEPLVDKNIFYNYFGLPATKRDLALKLTSQQPESRSQNGELTPRYGESAASDLNNHVQAVGGENEKEPPSFISDNEGLAVKNAGQVLFHPFLNALFDRLAWLNDKGHIASGFQHLAVQTLHYCASGNEVFFESDLVLEKFLCGVSLRQSVPAKSLLSQAVKSEVHKLLKHVITCWPELKNTSPDGLRELFVRRDGKLIQKDNTCKLLVERKAQDVLLEKLQWNISVVKMPWQKQLLFVEW